MRTASPELWVVFALAVSGLSFGNASEVTETTAKQHALQYVRSCLKVGADHFLRASRREDLEDDLFAAQAKVRGQIRKSAFFFEVTETGYEIRSPEEAVFHSSVDGAGRWYVAVNTTSGELYGLGGFADAGQAFNNLASNAKVALDSDESARNWANFYLTVVVAGAEGSFIMRRKDLERQVEDVAEAYKSSRKRTFTPKHWLQDLQKSGAEPSFGVGVRPDDGRYQIQVDAVATSDDRMPILQRLNFDISPQGTVNRRSVIRLFPRSASRQ
jgi:hypothetical protein